MSTTTESLLAAPFIERAPRKRSPRDTEPQWFALCDASGFILTYVKRRTETEARAELESTLLLKSGKVKKVTKPSIGWINGRIRKLNDRVRDTEREIRELEDLL